MDLESEDDRTVTLQICDRSGVVTGSLPPFQVQSPWWQDVRPVVQKAICEFGLRVVVLRILGAEPERTSGGEVTYLAELEPGQHLPAEFRRHWTAPDPPDRLRLSYAHPGGPATDLAWADRVLVRRGTPRQGRAEQMRTWNLSSLWRLPVEHGFVWLKVVPPFFAHEGKLLGKLDPTDVPPLIAADGVRSLLEEIPGPDRYEADGPVLLAMIGKLITLQCAWSGRVEELLALGLPDWRSAAFAPAASHSVEVSAAHLREDHRRDLVELLHDLPQRFADLAGCGVPDTLVHGDFHQGNVRGPDDSLRILDWGDSGVGHPMLDVPAFLERIPAASRSMAEREWMRSWSAVVPGSDPARAAVLIRPIAALRQAMIYQHFLERIEPSERIYHARDPLNWLQVTAAMVAAERDTRR